MCVQSSYYTNVVEHAQVCTCSSGVRDGYVHLLSSCLLSHHLFPSHRTLSPIHFFYMDGHSIIVLWLGFPMLLFHFKCLERQECKWGRQESWALHLLGGRAQEGAFDLACLADGCYEG